MKSSKVRFFLTVVIAALAAMPAAVAVAAPANVEYGFEPTPAASDNNSSLVEPGSGEVADNQGDRAVEVNTPNVFQILGDSWLLLVALVVLAGTLAVVTWRRFRSDGTSAGMLTRLVALLAVLVALPLISLSTAQSAKPPAAPDGFFGVISQTDINPAETVKMTRGGVETLRLPVPWYSIQPDNTETFDWGYTDTVISQFSKAGIKVLPFLYSSPEWATGSVTNLPVSNAKERQAWRDFMIAIVKRYGPGGDFWTLHGPDSEEPVPSNPITTWQIWNEANFFYFATPASPSRYFSLLKNSHDAIKSVDPSAKVMLSGLYGSPPDKQIKRGQAMTSYKFLSKLYAMGAKKYFEIAALHPYTPDTAQTAILLDRFRTVMKANGDRNKPLSITEVGWGSAPKGFLAKGSPAKQAAQLKSAYEYFLSNRKKLRLESVYWFAWKDVKASVATCNFCYTTGLFKAGDGLNPKPAWRQWVKFSGGTP